MTLEMTPQQRRRQERHDAEAEALRRKLNDFFQFCTVCSDKRCRRERACRGDCHACFRRWWPHVSEESKIHFRAAIKALVGGHTPAEAMRIAAAEVARVAALRAQIPAHSRESGNPEFIAAGSPLARGGAE
jgi:hypothetical protein